MLPTAPFWGGFARGTCSNLSPLKGEMSRSDRGVIQQNPRLEKNRKRTESEKREMLPQIFALFIESR